jgi:intein/homing endonuclease
MFERMWDFKFLPPGRGLWMMGTPFMWERGSAALQNCGFCSTHDRIESDPAEPFCFLMDMSMLGVGVGFDTKGANRIAIGKPAHATLRYMVPDSREGWVDSVRRLIWSYTIHREHGNVEFDYSHIRPAGADINGFGGKASGPGILIDLHDLIRAHLDRRIGRTLNSVDIVDIMNYIGKCVVAGNVRRSSEIAFGDVDDIAYCQMKNPCAHLENGESISFGAAAQALHARGQDRGALADFAETNIETEKLARAVETWNAMNHHRWASNNSVFARVGMDYQRVGEQIAANGEPGLIWLDNMRDYGRMIDGRQPGIDGRLAGANPCFAGSMRLLTRNGYVRMDDLWLSSGSQEYRGLGIDPVGKYGEQEIVNERGIVPATNVYRTGTNVELFRVTFDDGSAIDATANHEFIILEREKRRAPHQQLRIKLRDLRPGQKVPLNRTAHFGRHHDPAYAELAGWCIGDGSLSPKKDGQIRAVCSFYESDVAEAMPRLSALMHEVYLTHNRSSNQNPAFAGWHREQPSFQHHEESFGSNVLGRLLRDDGIVSGDKHRIPNSVWSGTRETVAAFLRGFASADGYIHISNNGTIGVRISQSNRQLLLDCKLLLQQFGIHGRVHKRRDSRKLLMNDGKGGKKLYKTKKAWELIIGGIKQVRLFLDSIGFIQNSKTVEAREWLQEHPGSNNSNTGRYASIRSIESIGVGDTYCLTEPGNNQVVIEGYAVGQCVEQGLESYELCNLCESFPANHEDPDDFMRTLKFAYLYAKTVTLLPTHNPRTNQVMLRNRRIGLSQSGIVQAFSKFGRRAVLQDFCEAGYNEIRRWDDVYAEWLCIQKSIKVTSVKPSGSVSLLAGATAGIHHPEASTYWRRVRINRDNILVPVLQDAGYHVEPAISDKERTAVVRFAVTDERVRPVCKVSIWEQMQNVADYQAYWADNQVSCTVKFAKEEAEEIPRVLEAFEDRIKGISFLPLSDHGYAQAPYEPCSTEEVEQYNTSLQEADYSRYVMEAVGDRYCTNDSCQL